MKTILIIEDEPTIQANIQEILALNNFSVATAGSGEAGLKLAQEMQPDLIICDIMMPGLDGYQVLATLRQQSTTAQIPLIFLTARCDRSDIRRGMELGADDCLTKPLEPAELLRSVAARLKRQSTLARHFSHQAQSPPTPLGRLTDDDSLTHLPSWLSLQKRFESLQHQPHCPPLALIGLKIIPFSAIRQDLGHSFSNRLLKAIAERLRSYWNSADASIDLMVYLGGDQFALLVQSLAAPINPPVEEIERLVAQLEQPFYINNRKVSIQVDTGIARYPEHGRDLDSLMNYAEKFIDQNRPQNQHHPSHPGMERQHRFRRLSLETALSQALEQEEFEIYYQPQIDLQTGQIAGAEALLRWVQPDEGYIPPGQFISLAEDASLIIPIGEWILHKVCSQIKQWHATKLEPVTVGVNVSAQQFRQPNFSGKIRQILQESQIEPLFLDLELTESLLVQDVALTIQMLQDLKNLGVNIAIDDFGAGYSSLSYLQLFPLDTLKIDQQFVRNIDQNPGNMVIVKAIIQMAHSLNLNTIAEGVETARELAFLRQHNCQIMQGHLFSLPLTAAEFEQLLTAKESFSTNPLAQKQRA